MIVKNLEPLLLVFLLHLNSFLGGEWGLNDFRTFRYDLSVGVNAFNFGAFLDSSIISMPYRHPALHIENTKLQHADPTVAIF